ncbi:MAG TPA: hypothetical protein VNB24_03325, partial [Acidimicrobiales bacterium]|nr:hypothetical protein [Acidimicrobiales bacterium]
MQLVSWQRRIQRRVHPYLDPGERIDAAFPAQTGVSPALQALVGGFLGALSAQALMRVGTPQGQQFAWFAALAGVGCLVSALMTAPWIVVATDRRLLVLAAHRLRRHVPVQLDAELPRQKFGRTSGVWRRVRVGDRVMRVHWRRAGSLGDADDALTRDGDTSIPEPVAGPSALQRSLVAAAIVAIVGPAFWLACRGGLTYADDPAPLSRLGAMTEVAAGKFADGSRWRVDAFRRRERACARSQLLPAPPVNPRVPTDGGYAVTGGASGSGCDNRFPQSLGGVSRGDARVFAGIVDNK